MINTGQKVVRFISLFEAQRIAKGNKRLRYYRDLDSDSNQHLLVSNVCAKSILLEKQV